MVAGEGSCWHIPGTGISLAARAPPGSQATLPQGPAPCSPGPAMHRHFASPFSVGPSSRILHPSQFGGPRLAVGCPGLLGTGGLREAQQPALAEPQWGWGVAAGGHPYGAPVSGDLPSPSLSPTKSPLPRASSAASAVTPRQRGTRQVTQPALSQPSRGARPAGQGVQAPTRR